ncbi:MAG TPA: HAMP domain-containing sensor histidine kinase [Burkholderiaceae bacterium]|nr:HAMP domain-containing sensor histidine kinase [Burkholderiaceae bacterium]
MSEQPFTERRRNDRRQGDRRHSRPMVEESWFGALGDGDTEMHADDAHIAAQPPLGRAAPHDAQRQRTREARRVATSSDTALRRVYRTYVAARAVLGLLLALVPWVVSTPNVRSPLPLILLCLGYAAQSITLWMLPHVRQRETPAMTHLGRRQWLATIGFDLVVFTALHLVDPGANLNFGALLVLPVLMSGVMTTRLAAVGTAAVVALVLLSGVWRTAPSFGDAGLLFTQAGLAGIGVFMIALLAGEFSGRLVREEMAARGSLEIARQQAQLNRLVIEEMTDGVLVVDRRARVRAANPAARALLAARGMVDPAPFPLHSNDAWATLQDAVERAFEQGEWPDSAREVRLMFDSGHSRTLQVRARFTRRRQLDGEHAPPEEFCVVFLEDLRTVQLRSRQEKLAAMGRVSAGIAHEIRNPLAAIAQANALLLEDLLSNDQHHLARMVADNVDRLKRIVDDVMEAAPGAAIEPRVLDASAAVRSVCTDWARTAQLSLGADSRLQLDLPGVPLTVAFDPDHLRRVLVNLLDNAARYASDASAAIRVHLFAPDERGAVLAVASDGATIAADVERHLFEPFFSTRSRGTGLGLYICRELCVRHGASIEFRPLDGGQRHHNEFRVTMQRTALAAQEAPSQA